MGLVITLISQVPRLTGYDMLLALTQLHGSWILHLVSIASTPYFRRRRRDPPLTLDNRFCSSPNVSRRGCRTTRAPCDAYRVGAAKGRANDAGTSPHTAATVLGHVRRLYYQECRTGITDRERAEEPYIHNTWSVALDCPYHLLHADLAIQAGSGMPR